MMHGNPSMQPGDDHAIKILLVKTEQELLGEPRQCEQCLLMAKLCEDYGRRLSAEMAENERWRRVVNGCAAYAAAVTLALAASWWAR